MLAERVENVENIVALATHQHIRVSHLLLGFCVESKAASKITTKIIRKLEFILAGKSERRSKGRKAPDILYAKESVGWD